MLFKPHTFAALETVEFPAGLLFGFVFSCSLEFTLGLLKGLHRSRGLVLLFASRLKIALRILVDGGVKVQQYVRALCFPIFIGKNDRDGPLCGSSADNPRDAFDGFSNGAPTVSLNGLFGLFKQAFNMAPMVLNQMAKPLLFLDFFRKACQRLFLLRLAAFQTFHFSRLSSPRPGLLKSLFFSALQSMGIVRSFPNVDGLTK